MCCHRFLKTERPSSSYRICRGVDTLCLFGMRDFLRFERAVVYEYIVQKVERRACNNFLNEGETVFEPEKFQSVDFFLSL